MFDRQNVPRPAPLTVSQLTNAIKLSLESTFPVIHLQGEVTNIKLQTSGHLYFSLKDANATIGAVMFKGEAAVLKSVPKAGDQVIVKGELSVYPPKGNYQLIIRELSYAGIGELLLKLEELKMKLHQLGWFKSSRKKPLPRFPKRIGVVTSPTGAVIQDIVNVLTRRYSGFHLILNPVKVQGAGAAEEIAQAIEQFNRYQLVDVMIVGRGGGSLEDLWAFNEEIVAAAIYHSQIPVISAVGHETDHCIADYVADVRAPTPSAAAEIVIAEKNQLLDNLKGVRQRIVQTLSHLIQQNRYRLDSFAKHPLFTHPLSMVELRMQKMDDYRADLEQALQRQLQFKRHLLNAKSQQAQALKPTNKILHFKQRFGTLEKNLQQNMERTLTQYRQKLSYKTEQLDYCWKTLQTKRRNSFNEERLKRDLLVLVKERSMLYRRKLDHLSEILHALDPKNLLKKGYSILFAENGTSVINTVSKLKKGEPVRLLLSDGEAQMTVDDLSTHRSYEGRIIS